MKFDRITVDPGRLDGRPGIRGLRVSVDTVVRLVAAGWSIDEILDAYPRLRADDITQALAYPATASSPGRRGSADRR